MNLLESTATLSFSREKELDIITIAPYPILQI